MSLKVGHIADLHCSERLLLGGEVVLDERGLNVRLADFERCMDAFGDQARAFGVELNLIAGDVFDRPKPTPNEERVAIAKLDDLARIAPTIVIDGNHDYNGTPGEATAITCLRGREDIHVAEQPGYFDFFGERALEWNPLGGAPRRERSPRRPRRARIFVLPWPSRAQLMAEEENAASTPEELNAKVSAKLQLLTETLRGLRAPGTPNLFVFHGTIEEAQVNEQPAALQGDIGLRAVDLRWFEYTALGHVHARQGFEPVLGGGMTAWYSGGLDRYAFGEEREDKGGNLVEVTEIRGEGSDASVHHQRTVEEVFADAPAAPGAERVVYDDGAPRTTAPVRFATTVHFAPTPARAYRTHTVEEVLARGIDDDGQTVHRVKGVVTEADLVEVRGRLAGMPVRHLVRDLEVEHDARLRDPAMRESMSTETLLRRRLEARGIAPDKVGRYLELHARLTTGIRP